MISATHHVRTLRAYARHHTTALKWIGRELKKVGIFAERQIAALAKGVLRALGGYALKQIAG